MGTLNYTASEVDQGINEQINGEMAQDTGYDDLIGTALSARKLDGGQLSVVSYGYGTDENFAALEMNETDALYFTLQTSHGMKLMTALENHIHYTLRADPTSTKRWMRFELSVAVAGVFGDWEQLVLGDGGSSGKSLIYDVDLMADNAHGHPPKKNKHWLTSFGDAPAGNSTVSSLYKVKLVRLPVVTDAYIGTAGGDYYNLYIDFFDSHYQIDQERGSKEPYSKEG